ncbi:MAG: GNAT family N-acetyltransferase [Actinomycetota bacterium]|nr:GNAT family N-acetyltransferase [Actinomycetota bacterium]
MAIREARTSDAHAIANVRVNSWKTGYSGILDESVLSALNIPDDEVTWTKYLSAQQVSQASLVVEEINPGTSAPGFSCLGPYRTLEPAAVQLSPEGTVGEIYAFYLHPDYWGSGIADELMTACIDRLRLDGWPLARLWVLTENARARRFYERHDWVVDGQSRELDLPGSPSEVRMTRHLH